MYSAVQVSIHYVIIDNWGIGNNLPPEAHHCALLDVPQVPHGQRNIRDFGSDMGLAHRLMPLSGSCENSHPGPEKGHITN
jgi:hypothetical protein